jgi:hypothetical protein
LELLLYFRHATGRVIGVCDIILVYAHVTASSTQHQVHYLGHGSCLVFTEAGDPVGCHILESVSAGENIGYV